MWSKNGVRKVDKKGKWSIDGVGVYQIWNENEVVEKRKVESE